MRTLAFLLTLSVLLPAQAKTERERELLEQLKKLQAKVERLQGENADLSAQAARLSILERHIRDHRDEIPPSDLPDVMPSMPYDEDLLFAVRSVSGKGSATAAGVVRHILDVELWEFPPATRKHLVERDYQGWIYLGFEGDKPPERARRYRMKIEDLKPGEARRWRRALSPRKYEDAKGTVSIVHRQISFPRVRTRQTFADGYRGNSGTVRTHRRLLHWYENNVFFLERGVLRVIGATHAGFHIRFGKLLKDTTPGILH